MIKLQLPGSPREPAHWEVVPNSVPRAQAAVRAGPCSCPAPRPSPSPSPRVVATRSGGGCSASPPARAVAIAEGSQPPLPGAAGLVSSPAKFTSVCAPARLLPPRRAVLPGSPLLAPRARPGQLRSPPGARTEAPRRGGDLSSPGAIS